MIKPRPDRPRNRHHHTTNHHTTTHAHGDTDISWLWPLVQVILAVFMLIFIVDLLIIAWPFILIGLIIFVIIAIFG